MARLPYLAAADAPLVVAAALAKVPPLNVITLLAHADTAFRPWLRFSGALLTKLALDPALRELAILQVGHLAARYEWDQHVPLALTVGVSQPEIDALDRGLLDGFSPDRRAVLDYVAAFIADEVDDTLHAPRRTPVLPRDRGVVPGRGPRPDAGPNHDRAPDRPRPTGRRGCPAPQAMSNRVQRNATAGPSVQRNAVRQPGAFS
ncbi:MAG: carboxymuconolactone decarboxylase family protein [Pseudonocardia sp.]